MAIIVNGDGILTGVSSLATSLTDLTSGRGTVTGVATVGTLQLGAGVSMSSPRTQNAAIFTNNTEFLTVDDAGRIGIGTVTPNSDAHPQNVGKINVGFITARSVAGDIDANTLVVAGIATFTDASTFKNNVTVTSGNLTMSGAGNIVLGDSASGTDDRITFGASTDMEIFHNGTNNHIDCHTAGQDLYIRPTKDVYFQDYATDDVLLKMVKDASVELYYNNSKKAETLNNGFTVTGSCYANNSGAGSGTSQIELQPYGTDAYLNVTASDNFYTRLGTGYTVRTRIDSSGHFHVSTGNLVIDTAGQGIDFSSTSDGSGTDSSELLDDYEEGSWTPTISGGAITASGAYYTKIGRVVHWYLYATITNTANNASEFRIYGLPYTVGSNSNGLNNYYGGASSFNYTQSANNAGLESIGVLTRTGDTYIYFHFVGRGDSNAPVNSYFHSHLLNQGFIIAGAYFV